MFIFKCPKCQSELEAQDEWNNLEAQCPNCDETIIIKKERKKTSRKPTTSAKKRTTSSKVKKNEIEDEEFYIFDFLIEHWYITVIVIGLGYYLLTGGSCSFAGNSKLEEQAKEAVRSYNYGANFEQMSAKVDKHGDNAFADVKTSHRGHVYYYNVKLEKQLDGKWIVTYVSRK